MEDDYALTREDPDAAEEARFVTLGLSSEQTPEDAMKKVAADRNRDIDFSRARRGAVVKPEPGKTKISIRLDKAVLDHFRDEVDKAGGGNYQTLINAALLEHIHRRSALDIVRRVLREELASYSPRQGAAAPTRSRASRIPRGR